MTPEIDTKWLIDHIDKKFADADRKRADGLEIVHKKIDDHARVARDALDAFRGETTAALGSLAVEIGKHDQRIGSIENRASTEKVRLDGWWKTGATIVLGGGGLATFLEWLRGKS